MIGRLTGIVAEKTPPQVLLDVQGVGYEVDVPMSTFCNLPGLGERTTLLTHLIVREAVVVGWGKGAADDHVGLCVERRREAQWGEARLSVQPIITA